MPRTSGGGWWPRPPCSTARPGRCSIGCTSRSARDVVDIGCGPIGILPAARRSGSGRTGASPVSIGTPRCSTTRPGPAPGSATCASPLGDATDSGLPRRHYDLAHIRLVLVNVPDPAAVVREAAAIVRPSGTVAVQEVDWLSWQCEPALPAWTELRELLTRLWHSRGLDPCIGRRLPSLLRAAGLREVDAQAHAGIDGTGQPYQRLLLTFADRFRSRLLDGITTADRARRPRRRRRHPPLPPGHRRRPGDDRPGLGSGTRPERAMSEPATCSTTAPSRPATASPPSPTPSTTGPVATCWRSGCAPVGRAGRSAPAGHACRRGSSDCVGPTGRVVATDIDVSWMPADAPFEVRRHDVAADPPPDGGFDLVHVRLVLTHVPQRAEALRRMASALRPGGWLVVEDFDVSIQPRACPDAATDDEDRANRVRAGFVELLVGRGVDPVLGRTLRKRLVALGLERRARRGLLAVGRPRDACAGEGEHPAAPRRPRRPRPGRRHRPPPRGPRRRARSRSPARRWSRPGAARRPRN